MLVQTTTRTRVLAELPGGPAAWPVQGAWRYEDYLLTANGLRSDDTTRRNMS